MKTIYIWTLACCAFLWVSLGCIPVQAANLPRRSVECRIVSKLYHSIHNKVDTLEDVSMAQLFATKLETDMKVLNFEDETLQKIQAAYVADFNEMAMIFKNIREGQLVGDEAVFDRMGGYYTATATHINATSKELNSYCKGVWGYASIPES